MIGHLPIHMIVDAEKSQKETAVIKISIEVALTLLPVGSNVLIR